jgi:hypothetical protein
MVPWGSEAEAEKAEAAEEAEASLRQPASRPQASEDGEEVGAGRGKGKGRQQSSVGGMGSMLCVSKDSSLRVVDMSSRQQVSPAASLTSRASSLSSPPASHFMTQTKACVGGTQALPQRPLATSFQAAAVNACGGEGGCCGAAEQDESELSSLVESERRTPLPPPPAWQAPPQLLALLAAAAALRGERECLCRHEVASIASISAAADLGSSAAACFADMWRIPAARLASASYQNRLCKVCGLVVMLKVCTSCGTHTHTLQLLASTPL